MNHVHILAICGYTTGGLALMAQKMSYIVTGSDEDAYPPMSYLLTERGIKWSNFHNPENLKKWGRPDLVIQGNQIREGNPELLEAQRQKLKILSDSEFFYQLTKNRQRIVVAGSHGKTTTSGLIAWILEVAGRRPGFRLGTVVKNFNESVRLGEGREFVFEGDEYTTSFSDLQPKYFHFHPQLAIINNIEWDHPDVFKSSTDYRDLFEKYLVTPMPRDGLVIYNAEDKQVQKVIKKASCRTSSFGLEKGDLQARQIKFSKNKTSFVVYNRDQKLGLFTTQLAGIHNVKNCLAAMAVGLISGVSILKIRQALSSFQGTSRRFEILGVIKGVTVIDDYAHHPTKIRETIDATKKRYPKSRLFVIYVPHTYSRTKALFESYKKAFIGADFLLIPDIEPARERRLSALVNSRVLVEAISKNQKNVFYMPHQKEVIDFVIKKSRPGDVVLCASVRGFDDLAQNFVKAFKYGKRKV